MKRKMWAWFVCLIISEKWPRKVESKAIICDPTPKNSMVGDLGWAKGPHGRGKLPPKRPIRKALRRTKALV